MTEAYSAVILLTLQVATVATVVVMIPGTALAWVLARREFWGKALLSTLVSVPLVLPPTAVGYLLLRLFAVNGPLGRETLGFDLDVLLTWKGAVIAAATMALPLYVRTARVTFESIDPRLETMARTLGHRPLRAFVAYSLPMASRGLLAATILGFTRAIGEFGATVTIAGSIPGRTRTLASAIYTAQSVGDDDAAWLLLGLAVAIGFAAILASEYLVRAPHRLSPR